MKRVEDSHPRVTRRDFVCGTAGAAGAGLLLLGNAAPGQTPAAKGLPGTALAFRTPVVASPWGRIVDYLHGHAREAVARHVRGYNDLAPMWFLSEADEPSRAVARKGCPEGSMAQFYDYASLFNAKAFALKEGRQELEKYLDVPGVWRGDLFYIQNLVSTIEADKPR